MAIARFWCTRTSASPSRSTFGRPPTSPTSYGTVSAYAPATGWPSPCATCRNGSVAFWAAAATGAILVPLNAWWTGDELAYGLADSGTKVLLCDREREERLAPHWPTLEHLDTVIVARGEGGASPMLGSASRVPFEELMAGVPGAPAEIDLPAIALAPDDDATIFYTSGTTGRPKGALGTHRNICGATDRLVLRRRAQRATCGWVIRRGGHRAAVAQRAAPVGAAVPRHRVPLDPDVEHHGRRQAGDDAPLGRRPGPGAHRTGADHHLRGRADHGHAGARPSRLRTTGHVERPQRRATAGRRRRPTWSGGSTSTSPAAERRPTATG